MGLRLHSFSRQVKKLPFSKDVSKQSHHRELRAATHPESIEMWTRSLRSKPRVVRSAEDMWTRSLRSPDMYMRSLRSPDMLMRALRSPDMLMRALRSSYRPTRADEDMWMRSLR